MTKPEECTCCQDSDCSCCLCCPVHGILQGVIITDAATGTIVRGRMDSDFEEID